MSNNLYGAFFAVCPDAEKCGVWYVTLYQCRPYYGGPEEGGWWGQDRIPVAVVECSTKSQAKKLAQQVYAKAEEMTREERNIFNDSCLASICDAEERGLSGDDLPEVGGPIEYTVSVGDKYPETTCGPRHYE